MEIIELDINKIATGIGRKATDEELIEYLTKELNAIPLTLDDAFLKYQPNL
jgi:hypothetical protein